MPSESSSSSLNVKRENNRVTIDLGNTQNHADVIVKGHNLREPLVIPGNSEIAKLKDKHTELLTVTPEAADGENAQTNSGIINRSQFNDGGFGDIGQQWKRVKLRNSSIINNHTSINLTFSGGEGTVHIDDNIFGSDQTQSGKHLHERKVRH